MLTRSVGRRALEVELQAVKRGTPTQELNIQKLRSALFRRIQKFQNLQQVFMPNIKQHLSPLQIEHLESPSSTHPERTRLFLPSDLRDDASRSASCLKGVVETETRLREGEINDALEDLRQGLRARTATNRFKTMNTTGQVANTRAQGVQRQIDIKVHTCKLRYRFARTALLKLKGHGVWEQRLQELKDEDVRGLNERALTAEEAMEVENLREMGLLNTLEPGGVASPGVVVVGESQRTLSWIWYNSGRTESDGAVMNEGMCQFPSI